MIPFTPEPIDQLKARYPAALLRVFDGSRVAAGEEESPAQIRTHIFDFDEDDLGIRRSSKQIHPQTRQPRVHSRFENEEM